MPCKRCKWPQHADGAALPERPRWYFTSDSSSPSSSNLTLTRTQSVLPLMPFVMSLCHVHTSTSNLLYLVCLKVDQLLIKQKVELVEGTVWKHVLLMAFVSLFCVNTTYSALFYFSALFSCDEQRKPLQGNIAICVHCWMQNTFL